MSQYTENYHLEKPDNTDEFKDFRQSYNDNMDKIDQNMGGGGGSSVSWSQLQVTGDKIATITVSGIPQDVFAPNSQTFTMAVSRANINSDETYSTIFGKIKKWFNDLKTVAFSGSYNDLSDQPTIPTNTSDLNNDSGFLDSSDITVTQVVSTGTKIATIDVGGTSTDLYAPASGGGSVNDVTVNGSSVVNAQGVAEITVPDELADLADDSTHRTVTDTEKSTWSAKVSDNPTFTEASTRANIASGESFATILGKIKKFFADLKAVAFSGSYNDLSDKPTIPTVNNAILTIQKNGSTVQTFTANASSDVTANITITDSDIFPNNTWRAVGDDVRIGDRNANGTLYVQGTNGTTRVRLCKQSDESNYADLVYDGTQFALTKNLKVTGMMTVERSDNDTVLYLKGNNANKTHIRFTASDDSVIGYLGIDKSSGTPKANVYYDGSNHYLALENNVIPYKTNTGIGRVKGDGTDAYCLIAEIKITDTYQNRPIYFEVSGRGYELSRLNVVFSNVNNTDPSLQIFTISQHRAIDDFKIFKTSTSTWQLYCHIGQWGDIALHRMSGLQSEICTPKMTKVYATALPVTWADGRVPTHGETFTGDVDVQGVLNVYNQIQLYATSWSKYIHLRVPTTVSAERQITLPNKDGTIALTSDISSRRYKENIVPLSDDEAKKLLDIDIVNYDYKEGVVEEDERYDQKGAIAEDVAELIPNAVTYADIDGEQLPDGINYTKFIPYLIKMVQMQQKEIEELKAMTKGE